MILPGAFHDYVQIFLPTCSRRVLSDYDFQESPHHMTLQFSIDGREGILQATDIIATFNLSVVLANATEYRQ